MQVRANNAARISVASAAATTTLLAARPGRAGFRVHNASSAILYLSYGTGGYQHRLLGSDRGGRFVRVLVPLLGDRHGLLGLGQWRRPHDGPVLS